jgi:HD-GYP domain-containing protein (c-di-GMP phosphodiesterase class II)
VTPSRPSSLALTEAKDVLRSMSLSRQAFALYEGGHPKRGEVLAEVVSPVRRLQELTPSGTVLFVGWGGFYLGTTLLPRASLTYGGLLEAFDAAGIHCVEFLPGLGEEGLEWLMERLVSRDGSSEPPAGSGIAVNRLSPAPEPDRSGSAIRELLRTYAAGLDFMRETALRVANGEPANIQAASRLADTLADQVIADPSAALLLTTVKSYDEYTYYHMVNVCILSLAIGQTIGLGREQVVALGVGGLLHDVGKITVPREILQQAGPLSEEQWRLVHRHPIDGVGLLISSGHDLDHPALPMILEHHVGYDRSGYPVLEGRRPSLPARIVAVADCFDALTSKRQYRKPEERRQALNIIQAAAGRGYDPRVVRIFVRTLGLFPIGSLVRLTTGETGVVVRNHDRLLARPVVRLLLDPRGHPAELQEIDLGEEVSGGGFRWSVGRIVGPGEVDVDMLALLSAGQLEVPSEEEGGPGLIHEPAHGEPVPAGYVEGETDSFPRPDAEIFSGGAG